MTAGILQQLPDQSLFQQASDDATGDVNAVLRRLQGLAEGDDSSPLSSVIRIIGDLEDRVNIDVSGLTEQLPQAIAVVQNLVPEATLEQIRSIESAYLEAQDFLKNSAIAKQVRDGSSLQTVAIAVIEDVLNLFDSKIADLVEQIIPGDQLTQIRNVFTNLDRFQTDFSSNQANLLPFLTENLIGVAPDLLQQPLSHLDNIYAALAPLQTNALATALNSPQQAVNTIASQLITAIDGLDPANPVHYQQIQAHLDGAETTIRSLFQSLGSLYQQIETVITNYAWDTVFSTYQTVLSAIQIDVPTLSVNGVIDSMMAVLNDLQSRLLMTLSADDLRDRMMGFSHKIRETFLQSGLGQIRQTLRGFLEKIRDAIAAVPTEEIQRLVEQMLGQIRTTLEDLGITTIAEQIEQAFTELETFITSNLNSTLNGQVRSGLSQILSQVRSLPIAGLIAQLSDAIAQVNQLIVDLETALQQYMQDFTDFVARLDTLNFEPISNEVITEIEALKTKLESINPNALSDIEKFALKTALGILESIDLEGQVLQGLVQGFGALQDQVKGLLGDITTALNQLNDQLSGFNPTVVLQPIQDLLDQAVGFINQLNGNLIMNPVKQQAGKLTDFLDDLKPSALLQPLQRPYNTMMQVVNQLDPAEWTAPLNVLYAEIDKLIAYIDITPLMEDLEQRRQNLFSQARTTLLEGLAGLNLPEPLQGFWEGIQAVLEGLTDAILGDPATEVPKISLDLKARFKISSLFDPLDAIFDRLLTTLSSIPKTALTNTLNTIRSTLGTGLDRLNPSAIVQQFRQAQRRLSDLLPTLSLGSVLSFPTLKQTFTLKVAAAPSSQASAIASISLKFDAIATLIDPAQPSSLIKPLLDTYNRLVTTFRQRVNGLSLDSLEVVYANLRDRLNQLLPDFLRQSTPLSESDILRGLHSLRPSHQVGRLDAAVESFLKALEPLETVISPAINEFLNTLRDAVNLVNPLTLSDAVESIYDTIRAKVRILNPTTLADAIRTNILDPLKVPLDAINPQTIGTRLDQVFNRTLSTVTNALSTLLNDITQALDEILGQIRLEIQGVVGQIKITFQTIGDSLKAILDRLEQIVFVEILERLNRVIDNLGVSFEQELNRVRSAFDAMLDAIPLSSSSSDSVSLAA
jgi:phage-related protein